MTEDVIERYDTFNTKGCPEDLIFGDFNDQPIPSTGLSDTKGPGQLILGNTVEYKEVCRLYPGEYVKLHQEDEP